MASRSTICAGESPNRFLEIFRPDFVLQVVPLRRPYHSNAVSEKLKEILVARDDPHVETLSGRLQRDRRYDVVRLVPGRGKDGQPHRLQHILYYRDLRAHVVRHRHPVRLVLFVLLMPPRLLLGVEDDDEAVRGVFLHQPQDDADKAVHGARVLPAGVRQRIPYEGVVGSVGYGVAVNEKNCHATTSSFRCRVQGIGPYVFLDGARHQIAHRSPLRDHVADRARRNRIRAGRHHDNRRFARHAGRDFVARPLHGEDRGVSEDDVRLPPRAHLTKRIRSDKKVDIRPCRNRAS